MFWLNYLPLLPKALFFTSQWAVGNLCLCCLFLNFTLVSLFVELVGTFFILCEYSTDLFHGSAQCFSDGLTWWAMLRCLFLCDAWFIVPCPVLNLPSGLELVWVRLRVWNDSKTIASVFEKQSKWGAWTEQRGVWLKPLIEENHKIALWFKHWMKSKKQKRMKGRGKISSAFSKWLDIFTEFQAQHGGYFCVECCTEASFSLFNLCITIGKCQKCKREYTDIFFSLMCTFGLLAASVCLLIRFLFLFSFLFPQGWPELCAPEESHGSSKHLQNETRRDWRVPA